MSLFRRTIDIDINAHSDGVFSLVTTLSDMYHDIVLTLLISVPEYKIVDAAVDMKKIPHAACRQTYPLVRALTGQQITAGFTRNVLHALGGENGCPNLVNLMLVSAPLVMNAAAVLRMQQENLSQAELEELWHGILGGVCIAYSGNERKGDEQ
ncbi:MAG: DUF2889 domain-containing protein [Dethiobacter sp.]|nr:DUF2889 domain-containing protein [Dethiobacter sp.]